MAMDHRLIKSAGGFIYAKGLTGYIVPYALNFTLSTSLQT
jgi:hypothetical protein